ncbi:MAG: glycosyltransferase [Acidobacteriota bacterium]
MTVSRGSTSPRPLLSAALIVRDEERFLGDCLASLDGVVDEVVVVDTGSRDRTREIAEAAGARLSHVEWRDDFAAARNAALDACRSEWILYIDADERVVGGADGAFRAQLRDPGLVGLTVLFRPATGYTSYREPRLFRRHPDVRFRGAIHESHLPDLYRLAHKERMTIGHSTLALHHLGYDGDISHKHPRNLPLLEARVREDPDHIYSWWHLGQTLAGLGRPEEAEAAWREGLAASRRAAGAPVARYLPHLALLEHALLHRGVFDRDLWREAWGLAPGLPTLLWIRARHRLGGRRWREAADDLEAILATPRDGVIARQYAVEERLFTVLAPSALADCYFQLGRYADAERLYGGLAAVDVAGESGASSAREFEVKARLAAARRTRRTAPRRGRAASPGEGGATGDG